MLDTAEVKVTADDDEILKNGSTIYHGGLKKLIEKKADLNRSNQKGETVLHYSLTSQDLGLLLAAKADPNVESENGTPLHAAVVQAPGAIKQLLDAKANPNLLGSGYHGTALHGAVVTQASDIVKQLIEANSDLNQQNKIMGSTPLHTALLIRDQYYEIIELLLKAKADPNIVDKDGRTVSDYACLNFGRIMSTLTDAGAKCRDVNWEKLTELLKKGNAYAISDSKDDTLEIKHLTQLPQKSCFPLIVASLCGLVGLVGAIEIALRTKDVLTETFFYSIIATEIVLTIILAYSAYRTAANLVVQLQEGAGEEKAFALKT
jgi:uncharacterized protein YheU (UPF0270 family)